MPRSRPLSTHLAISHGAIGLLACLATGVLLALLLPSFYLRQRERTLIGEGRGLAVQLAAWMSGERQLQPLVLAGPETVDLTVLDTQQQVVARSGGMGMGGGGMGMHGRGVGRGMMMGQPTSPQADQVWQSRWKAILAGETVSGRVSPSGEGALFVAAVPIVSDSRVLGALVLQARLADLRGAASAFVPLILLASVAMALLALLAGILVSRRMARPLRGMTEAAHRVAEGDLAVQVSPPAWQEGELLAEAFNRMTESLAAHEASRRQFIADASHQLRAPLTTLQAQAEALLDRVVTDESIRQRFLARIVEGTKSLSSLAQELLDLERLESGEQAPDRRPMELPPLLKEVAAAFGAADSRQLLIEAPDDLPRVRADAGEVRQALINLVENALKHSPADGTVCLVTSVNGGMVRVSVEDEGNGIPAQELPHVWDRFYRVPGDETEGSGLGLAITKRLIERQQGGVGAGSAPGRGSTFWFELPQAGNLSE